MRGYLACVLAAEAVERRGLSPPGCLSVAVQLHEQALAVAQRGSLQLQGLGEGQTVAVEPEPGELHVILRAAGEL